MSAPWIIERRRILATVASILLLGGVSGYWIPSIILPSALYIGWQLLQFYRLDQWMSKGFKPNQAPHSGGAWESIITRIMKMRKQDKALKKRLARTGKGYRNTIKALPDAAIVVNEQLEIEWSNQVAEHLLGINSKQDTGYRITNLIRIPEFLAYLTNPSNKTLELESPAIDGLILSIQVIRYGQNQRLILARDISERVRIRNALKAFISNASHELRTPLTVTSGYIDIIRDDPELPDHLQAPVEQLREQTTHMSQMISDLLTLSQLEGDTLAEYEGRSVDLPAMLSQFSQNLENSGLSSEHNIQLDIDTDLGLLGIEKELISIYSNLIENAVRHTPPGTLIKVRWHTNPEGQACFSVEDNGPGFDPKHIPQLTQRFFRINSPTSGTYEGTGLGLAIVKHAVTRHNGSLHIHSGRGKGATFKTCFPASRRLSLHKN